MSDAAPSNPALLNPALKAAGAGKVYGTAKHRALRAVDFEVRAGETVALIGRSGAGKSTLARCLAGLDHLSEGEIFVEGRRVWPGLRRPTPGVQLVFQDSPMALNPRWTVENLIGEPLRLHGWKDKGRRGERVLQLMEEAGLSVELFERRPAQLSGGQRQRVAIARALAVPEVRVLILDEPMAGLDQSNEGRISSLLAGLQRRHSLALVYISHDLAAALRLADRVVVLENGCAVEQSPAETFATGAQHPASRALLAAMLPEREI